MIRPTESVPPPAPHGTMKVRGRTGYSAARARPVQSRSDRTRRDRRVIAPASVRTAAWEATEKSSRGDAEFRLRIRKNAQRRAQRFPHFATFSSGR
jgi:hypothetical protein